MTGVVRIRDRVLLERYLRRHAGLNAFRLTDLESPAWNRTRWFGLLRGRRLAAVALLLSGRPPLLVAYADGTGRRDALQLLRMLQPELPRELMVDLAPGLRTALAPRFRYARGAEGPHARMVLARRDLIRAEESSDVVALHRRDLRDLRALYRRAYPATFFRPAHLALGHFFGVRIGGRLVGAGGLLAFSRRTGVACLGNIATDPRYRRRGIATRITARICRSVASFAPLIGLCVLERNRAAIRCYRRLGFQVICRTDVTYAVARPVSVAG